MTKYIVKTYTNWCGEDLEYRIETDDIDDFHDQIQDLSYNNFSDFDGFSTILGELFPDVEGDYTDKMEQEAIEVEGEYYGYSIEEFEGSNEEWELYDEL